MSKLNIYLFGYPQILLGDASLQVERRKTLALVAFLVVGAFNSKPWIPKRSGQGPRGYGRESLATLLWPECSQEQAGAYLRQALWDFSKAAGAEWLVKDGQRIYINPQAEVWVDVNAFEAGIAAWKAGEAAGADTIPFLERLVALYRGDFMAGFILRDSTAFDGWQSLQTETLRLHQIQALEALVDLYAEKGNIEASLAHNRRWLEFDPWNESAHRALMRLYEQAGQRNAALQQYESLSRILRNELGVDPEAETTALYRRILEERLETLSMTAPAILERTPQVEKGSHPRPSGNVTFLFTDIEGSTRLWETQPAAMQTAFARQEAILREVFTAHGGYVYKMIGDAFQVAFNNAPAALAAALEAQRILCREDWGPIGQIKVRMALHTGVTEERGDDYVGPDLNRLGRILSAGHGGQVLLSQVVFELVRDHLPAGASLRDLGERQLKDLAHAEHLYQLLAADLPEEFPPLVTAEPGGTLPAQTTPFVGRTNELIQIEALLANPDCRLISLVGIGGSGKTRLAVEAARQSMVFADNVYFVGLAAISSMEDMLPAMAEVVRFKFSAPPGASIPLATAKAQLLRHLVDKKYLLVLDNFEQLTAYGDFLNDLLQAAPKLKLLVTTRECLNLPGEWVFEVTGLSYPSHRDREKLSHFAAVQLFVKGAERSSGFSPTAADWPAIARICQLLAGMPLGIEMAAAWIKLLSCEEIAAEIERNLDFLAAGWRGAPERHQSLRAVFEHSWSVLTESEREAFCRLSVFQGGFTRAAALAVAGAPLPLLVGLVNRAFVSHIPSGRFEIHAVMQAYAAEKLFTDPVALAETQWRFANYYSEWQAGMFEQLKGSEQQTALNLLQDEIHNLRSAFHYLAAQRDYARLERALLATILGAEMQDQRVERRELARLLLDLRDDMLANPDLVYTKERPVSTYPELLALVMAALHRFDLDPAHPERAKLYQEESLRLAQSLPSNSIKPFVLLLNCTGPVFLPSQQTVELCLECITLFQEQDDLWGAAMAQVVLADAANFSEWDLSLARSNYQAGLEGFTSLGNEWGQGLSLTGLASVAAKTGQMEEAYRFGCQSLELLERLGNYERIQMVSQVVAEAAGKLGKPYNG